MYYLFIDAAAGEYEITSRPDQVGPHFNLVKEFPTKEAAHSVVQQIKAESTVYAVFFDGPALRGYVFKEDALSGNWRGSKHHPYNCVAEFGTEAEAEDYLATLLS